MIAATQLPLTSTQAPQVIPSILNSHFALSGRTNGEISPESATGPLLERIGDFGKKEVRAADTGPTIESIANRVD